MNWRSHYDTAEQRELEHQGHEAAVQHGVQPLSRQRVRAIKRQIAKAEAALAGRKQRKVKGHTFA